MQNEQTAVSELSKSKGVPHNGPDAAIVDRFNDRMELLKRKRRKVPLRMGESFESWLEKHDETLEPLRDFFRLHEIDADWAIAELYKNGYWGKKLMGTIVGSKNDDIAREQTGRNPWDVALDLWSKALDEEKLPHAPLDIVRRWPSLLCKTPECLPGTVAVLRAAIPNEDALHDTIAGYPRVLIQSPVKLQHRVLALQMACGMDLSRVLPKNPQLFYRNLESIMANIRYLRDNAWSLEHFESLIDYRPSILTMHPDVVKRNAQSSLEAIAMVLPPEADASLVIKAKPQLILIPPSHITERWEALMTLTDQIPEWKDEVHEAIEDIQKASSGNTKSQRQLDVESLHPSKGSFGVQSRAAPPNTGNRTDQEISSDEWEIGEWGSTALGAALWAHPKRHERLEYLCALRPDDAGQLSFVDALTVHFHRFNHRFEEFEDWVRDKEKYE